MTGDTPALPGTVDAMIAGASACRYAAPVQPVLDGMVAGLIVCRNALAYPGEPQTLQVSAGVWEPLAELVQKHLPGLHVSFEFVKGRNDVVEMTAVLAESDGR